MDNVSPEVRSKNMAAVKGKNTTPELKLRSALHLMGYRFRLHLRNLPGNPDIVLPRHKICIFVHGCFWHQHSGCKRSTVPSTRTDFWLQKFLRTKERDLQAIESLHALGWKVAVVWECETKNDAAIYEAIRATFSPGIKIL